MATTSPDNIWTPDSGDDYALTVDLAATADTIQAALNSKVSTVGYDSGNVPITLNGGWSNFSGTASVRVRGGMASLNGRISAAASGPTQVAFVLPGFAFPSEERVTTVMRAAGNTYETLIIGVNGSVTFFNLTLPAADYRLASIPPWPVA